MNYYFDVLKQYANFEGRTGRKNFWMFILIHLAISFILGAIDAFLLSSLYALALIIPCLAVGARRLHDTNRSGWWQLISLIPLIGWIILIVFLAKEGDEGENKYGSNPKKIGSDNQNSQPQEIKIEETKQEEIKIEETKQEEIKS